MVSKSPAASEFCDSSARLRAPQPVLWQRATTFADLLIITDGAGGGKKFIRRPNYKEDVLGTRIAAAAEGFSPLLTPSHLREQSFYVHREDFLSIIAPHLESRARARSFHPASLLSGLGTTAPCQLTWNSKMQPHHSRDQKRHMCNASVPVVAVVAALRHRCSALIPSVSDAVPVSFQMQFVKK